MADIFYYYVQASASDDVPIDYSIFPAMLAVVCKRSPKLSLQRLIIEQVFPRSDHPKNFDIKFMKSVDKILSIVSDKNSEVPVGGYPWICFAVAYIGYHAILRDLLDKSSETVNIELYSLYMSRCQDYLLENSTNIYLRELLYTHIEQTEKFVESYKSNPTKQNISRWINFMKRYVKSS